MAMDNKTGVVFTAPKPINRVTTVESGRVRGIAGNSPRYTVFKGIPYAKPPVGPLRWKKPQPPEGWSGIRDCSSFGNIAPQEGFPEDLMYGKEFFQNGAVCDEDCLYLNIWTPSRNMSEDKYPVLFWIHGGALFGGNGHEPEFDGEEFCKNGVLLVTINYRLGIFGFLAHPELSAEDGEMGISGNYGHYDQLAALEWVYRNIKNFGGDPENITVAGQSAGAGSVQTLVTSKLTGNMIRRAIIQSGVGVSGLRPKNMDAKSLQNAQIMGVKLMKAAGCTNIRQMREMTFEQLSAIPGMGFGGEFTLGTIVDGYLVEQPADVAVLKGDYKKIPYLIGNTAGESALFLLPKDHFERNARDSYGDTAERYLALANVHTDADVLRAESQTHAMEVGNRVFATINNKLERPPVYLYRFDRNLPGTDVDDSNPTILKGSFHSSELWYTFKTVNRCWRPMNGIDYDLATAMNAYWSNFVKCGDPNGNGLPEWKPFTNTEQAYMHLADKIELKTDAVPEIRQCLIDMVIRKAVH